MLTQMGCIYSQSVLTIVASAGHSSADGLPGISTPRSQHTTIPTPGYELVQMGSNAEPTIRQSDWSTRAWTLQEALLSPRLLFFTKSHWALQCTEEKCEEFGSCPEKPFMASVG